MYLWHPVDEGTFPGENFANEVMCYRFENKSQTELVDIIKELNKKIKNLEGIIAIGWK